MSNREPKAWITVNGRHIPIFDEDEQVKTFEGRATYMGTFTHEGEREMVNFFKENSNYQELINSMSDEEKDAFEGWASGEFMGNNIPEFEQGVYDKYLSQATLNSGIKVRRIGGGELLNGKTDYDTIKSMVGKTITSNKPLSTAAAATGLDKSEGSNKIHYEIDIPKSKGAGMFIGSPKINHWGASQREFMLNRNTEFEISDVQKNNDGTIDVKLRFRGLNKKGN